MKLIDCSTYRAERPESSTGAVRRGCTSSWFLTLQKCGFQQNKPEDLSVLQQCHFLGGDPDVVLLTGVPGRQRSSVCRGKKQMKSYRENDIN